MKSLKEWQKVNEFVAPAVTSPGENPEEVVTAKDEDFYQAHLYGRIERYLTWLTEELARKHEGLSTVRKAFIVQEVMDSLGLSAGQIGRMSNNIKNAIQRVKMRASQVRRTPTTSGEMATNTQAPAQRMAPAQSAPAAVNPTGQNNPNFTP